MQKHDMDYSYVCLAGPSRQAAKLKTVAAPEDSEVDIVHAAKQGDVDRFWLPLRRILGQDVGIMGAQSAQTKLGQFVEVRQVMRCAECPVHVMSMPCQLSLE